MGHPVLSCFGNPFNVDLGEVEKWMRVMMLTCGILRYLQSTAIDLCSVCCCFFLVLLLTFFSVRFLTRYIFCPSSSHDLFSEASIFGLQFDGSKGGKENAINYKANFQFLLLSFSSVSPSQIFGKCFGFFYLCIIL